MRKLLVPLCALGALVSAAPVLAQPEPDLAGLAERLGPALETAADEDRFSGSILVMNGDERVFAGAYGLAHRGHAVPNRIDTAFNLGSLDKQFTMVAVLRLVEAGQLDLDATVGTYLPDYPNAEVRDRVTIRHLLTHTSGMGFYWNDVLFREIGRFRSVSDFAALFETDPLAFEPGTQWAYSNNGYIVLGLILEGVTGETYADHVRRTIFEPLGMDRTGSFAVDEITPNLATGYTHLHVLDLLSQTETEPREAWYANYYTHPPRGASAGGGYSTVEDLAIFSRALRDGQLLSDAHTAMILEPYNAELVGDESGAYYGYAMQVWAPGTAEHRYGHTGGGAGNGAVWIHYPAYDLTVVSLTNLEGSGSVPFRVINEVVAGWRTE
jgi:CubicO group peptidase (beta-lactamase class C family)